VFNPHVTDKLDSLFAQDEVGVIKERLWITVGSKFLHNNYTGFEFEPTMRLLWAVSSRQSMWAAVTRAVRTPSRVEEDLQLTGLISNNPPLFARAIGDGRFTSERLIGYEAGYRTLVVSKLYQDLAAFYNQYTHLLSVEPGTAFLEASPPPTHLVFPLYLRNGKLGNTAGVEVAPDWRPTPWWRLQGSYSFLHLDFTRALQQPGLLDRQINGGIESPSSNRGAIVDQTTEKAGV
jgi:iron complex outermembrane receptor protein